MLLLNLLNKQVLQSVKNTDFRKTAHRTGGARCHPFVPPATVVLSPRQRATLSTICPRNAGSLRREEGFGERSRGRR
jgi:hypothetical protein